MARSRLLRTIKPWPEKPKKPKPQLEMFDQDQYKPDDRKPKWVRLREMVKR